MCEVNQQNETNQQEQTGSDHGDVVSPDNKEWVRNEEGKDDHGKPADDLWAPESILNWCAAILGRSYSEKHQSHEDVEETQGEVDPLYRDVSVALFPVALDVHVVQGEMRQFLHSPIREHDPRHDRVEQEDEGVGDTSSNTSHCQYDTLCRSCIYTPVPTLPST